MYVGLAPPRPGKERVQAASACLYPCYFFGGVSYFSFISSIFFSMFRNLASGVFRYSR